jgi:hypothetical protein
VEQVLRRVERFPLGGERWQGKGIRRWIPHRKYIHMYVNAKMIPIETIPGMGVEGLIQVWYIFVTL